jgi:hypothetical protein
MGALEKRAFLEFFLLILFFCYFSIPPFFVTFCMNIFDVFIAGTPKPPYAQVAHLDWFTTIAAYWGNPVLGFAAANR